MNDPAIENLSDQCSPSRAALLEAALAMFLEHGFAAARVEDIAARAGISKGAVYLHFATKKDLFEAVVQAGVTARIERAERYVAGFSGPSTALLDTMLRDNLLDFWDSPSSGIGKLVIAESQQFPELADLHYREVTGRVRRLLEGILLNGIERGEYRAVDVPYTVRCILDAIDHELVLAHSLNGETGERIEPRRFVAALLDLIHHGLVRTPAS